jgi:hypothetical protein
MKQVQANGPEITPTPQSRYQVTLIGDETVYQAVATLQEIMNRLALDLISIALPTRFQQTYLSDTHALSLTAMPEVTK